MLLSSTSNGENNTINIIVYGYGICIGNNKIKIAEVVFVHFTFSTPRYAIKRRIEFSIFTEESRGRTLVWVILCSGPVCLPLRFIFSSTIQRWYAVRYRFNPSYTMTLSLIHSKNIVLLFVFFLYNRTHYLIPSRCTSGVFVGGGYLRIIQIQYNNG